MIIDGITNAAGDGIKDGLIETADLAASAQPATVVHEGSGPNVTTTATAMEDLTNFTVDITTGANRVAFSFIGNWRNDTATDSTYFRILIDGNPIFTQQRSEQAVATEAQTICLSGLSDVLTAGLHTIKIQWSTDLAGPAHLFPSNSRLSVWEVK